MTAKSCVPLRANSYMDFCCDGNVTLDVTAICCGFHAVISYMDFCCDGNVTRDVTVTMDGGDDFQSILTKDISSISKLFSIFSINYFPSIFTRC